MSIIISIIVFILIFSVLILIHECGHFWAAKRAGVRVEEFGFGLPPRMWGKKKGDTLYSINWIPFGGFVRLFGEDPTAFRATKAKDSFLTKTPWQKITIVLGGVFMNFLLAWVLLTFGLIIGIEPLIVGYDQFVDRVNDGKISMSPYHVFEEANEEFNVQAGDYLLEINGESLESIANVNDYVNGLEEEQIRLKVRHFNGQLLDDPYSMGVGSVDSGHDVLKADFEGSFALYPAANVARAEMLKDAELLGLEKGDLVLRVNEKEVLGGETFLDTVYDGGVREIDVLRGGKLVNLTPNLHFTQTIVDRVLPDSPADTAGVLEGDVFVSVEGENVYAPMEVKTATMEAENEVVKYVFDRNGEEMTFEITPEEGMIGVALSPVKMTKGLDMSFSETLRIGSVLEIEKDRVGVLRAPFYAFSEIKNLSLLTAEMMGDVFAKLFSSGEVPDSVAGPVGIAQMTYSSVQNGFMDVIRFTAILSLSLGVLNILPFPALDGGRFVFVLIEAITGRKLDHKFEAMIHAIGFAILLLLIVLITWNDIMRFF